MRYFFHPESDCLFTQEDDESDPDDGLTVELNPEEYVQLKLQLERVKMTVEANLERIANALDVIARVAVSGKAEVPAANDAPEAAPAASEPAAPRGRGRPRKEQPVAADPPPPPNPAPVQVDFLSDSPPAEQPAPTRQDVRDALVAFQKRTGSPERARKLLKDVGGADTLVALAEANFAKVIEAAKQAA